MPNRLAQENSPYLLQHAHNPVDWFPWGAEALEKARAEDKPIFLSVGYAACHWCHVMEHESFENHATAALMNAYFVNIKVDREERPDIDDIYMQAVVAMTHQGGWPMSVFLTPEGQPFYGGTYFPPARRYNMPGFNEVLQTVAQLWQEDRQQLLESAQNISAYLQNNAPQPGTTAPLTPQVTEEAAQLLAQNYDWQNGGWGQAPKFPQPMIIEFLLQRAARSDQTALKISEHALQAMAQGGMYDVVGGGFARYSVDNHWKIPHFEKMLY
ncbi:MAG TPA: thioredoxin domain-containing protein, partial [Chloroflexi bacterium]|nr:thioredoxin domain-containing protein [Chloroflexota bacterium]